MTHQKPCTHRLLALKSRDAQRVSSSERTTNVLVLTVGPVRIHRHRPVFASMFGCRATTIGRSLKKSSDTLPPTQSTSGTPGCRKSPKSVKFTAWYRSATNPCRPLGSLMGSNAEVGTRTPPCTRTCSPGRAVHVIRPEAQPESTSLSCKSPVPSITE